MAKVEIKCDGIMCDSSVHFDIPDWIAPFGIEYGGDSSYLYCPQCKMQSEFFRKQCPGCVAGFPECGFGESFMYSNSHGLSEQEKASIRGGACPFRVNGSFSFNSATGEFKRENISDIAPCASGEAVLKAAEAYIEKYPLKQQPRTEGRK